MSEKNICFLYVTINNSENKHNISMDINVEKKKLYYYERLTSIDYELGHMENNEYEIDKKSKKILVKPKCAHFELNHELALKKGIEPDILINKLLKQLKRINIIVCNDAKFTLNSLLAEAVRYNIQLDFNKILVIDLDLDPNEISSIQLIKDSFFSNFN